MNLGILFFWFLLFNAAVFCKHAKIIGGEIAHIFEFPHQVSFRILKTNEHGCGGSIISHWHILTVAHCFENVTDVSNDVIVYAGVTTLSAMYRKFYKITRVTPHPEYTGLTSTEGSYLHDIAVVTLQNYITFSSYQFQIDLPTRNIPVGANCYISGWGARSYPVHAFSDHLQKTWMTILNQSDCESSFEFKIHKEQFCAFRAHGIGLCTGDSGGALVFNGIVIGISSFIYPCAVGHPDVFINVYYYLDFISSIIGISIF